MKWPAMPPKENLVENKTARALLGVLGSPRGHFREPGDFGVNKAERVCLRKS